MQWFPIVGSIIVTLIFILIGIYAFRNRRGSGYHSGGFVSDYPGIRPGEIAVQLHSEDRASPHLRSIIDRIKTMKTRSTYHRDTRAVLEVLDLMQRPAVREAVMPEIQRRYIAPVAPQPVCGLGEPLPDDKAGRIDVNGNITWLNGYSLSSGTVRIHLDEAEKAQQHGWEIVGWPQGRCLVNRDSKNDWDYSVSPSVAPPSEVTSELRHTEILFDEHTDADQASRFFASEGEPMATPPPPNIGGLDHPPYAGPNYADEHEIADEMKGIRHYGTEPAETSYDGLIGKAVTINDPPGAFHGRTGVVAETRRSPLPIGVSLDGAKPDDDLVWVHYAEIA